MVVEKRRLRVEPGGEDVGTSMKRDRGRFGGGVRGK